MTFQNHWLIKYTDYSNKATVKCKNYMFISSQCKSDFVQHKHNPEKKKSCLYMYTANLSENLKKSE